ncbi:aldo/keto reductase [Pseudonocardia benzenivorans]|jgi:aryl-alcohol dehydrogenase-like predicted oxidoreductase|uniref:Aryl-alcohol dehydrogenase (NADP(+)) n=2 Tax=Pseudonocardia TaxID=1847 RepID=F4CW78_PSEUX|nr:aldo/keto reductase [Pseudonocardia dioxanivorans]AEA27496.1 Aryl-alcohol dehydrogenase (NADP(+)) [Pseudonocardia dioxanivorans CB1190]GJF06891.1 NADP-dependent aryl-alcohol dehydrogenase [Pseudonocardia sp. D17]
MTTLGSSDLDVSPLCLGGNVFGWTADEAESFAVLDAFAEAGGDFVDTADSYFWRKPGNSGGESETIIGNWMAARGNRDRMVVATKVGNLPSRPGLSAANIAAAAEDCLRRLRTDHIDLLYAHSDDESVAQEETLDAFDTLVKAGKVRVLGASNFTAERLRSALEISARDGLARYEVLQPHYNLMERADFEASLAPLLQAENISCLPYYALAKGFLTGKYRDGADVDSVRAEGAMAYLDDRGRRVLTVLDEIAAGHGVPVASVALGWLAAQPTVAAPIASARTTAQLAELLPMLDLKLTDDEIRLLSHVSA